MQMVDRIKRSFQIMRLTNFRYFRPAHLSRETIKFKINSVNVNIKGRSIWSMISEIVLDDAYHLRDQVSPKVIIDVGANAGIFSLHAATLFPECKIFAVEPSPDNFSFLTENTKSFKNIICINEAISSFSGEGYLSNDVDNTAYKLSTKELSASEKICKITSLNDFLYQHSISTVDILKLDCEGAEYEILKSDLSKVKQIVGEYHVVANKDPLEIKRILLKNNFIIKQWNDFPLGNAGLFWASNDEYHD